MKEKEEFSRLDPDSSHTFRWLALLNWVVPICLVITGLIITTQKFASLMNYDPRVVGKPAFIFKNGYRLYNPLVFLIGMMKFAFNDAYSYYFFQAIPATFICLSLAALIFVITSILLSCHQKNQHIHGTARYATRKDLKNYGMLQRHGVVCGELAEAKIPYKIDVEKASLTLHCKKPAPLICHSGRTNTLMIAPTRSGKGVSTVIPTCLNYGVPYRAYDKKSHKKVIKGRGSMVIFDPKGENWAATAGYRSKFSKVIPFRPLDPNDNTAHYNPIWEIPDSPSEAFSWADTIGEIFFGGDTAKAASDGATQYFNNTARDIFSGVVLHVRFCKSIPWKEKNLATVLHIFSSATNDDEKKAGASNANPQNQNEENGGPGAKMLEELIKSDHGNEKIHQLIVEAANRSKIQTPKERASTYSTVFSKISLFQDPLLAQSTAYSDFSVDDFINSKNANEVKLKIPCLFLLDEFPVLGFFPDIALNAGILAGYGVTFFIVCQALNQIVDVYGENHPFLDHCKTIILYAPGSIKDARTFSESIGNRSVLLDNISASGSKFQAGFSSYSRSSQETSTTLINPDELMKLEFSRAIIMNQGMPPYKGKKVVYYEDPRFKNKAFLEIPSMDWIRHQMKSLPSNKIKHKDESPIAKTIKEVESVSISRLVPANYDPFGTETA